MLIKDSFDRFMNCKSTIDDIHVRLQVGLSVGARASKTLGPEPWALNPEPMP